MEKNIRIVKHLKVGDKIRILNFPLDINIPIQTIKKIKYPYFWSDHFAAGNLTETEYEIVK